MELTIQYKGVEFEVEFDYEQEEPCVMYYRDGSGYPGSPGGVECISEFKHKGTCFMQFAEEDEYYIKELIQEKLNEL
jgi:hypothetical protein